MNTLLFKRKLPIWKLILGSIALTVGIISLFSSFKGFILIGMGIFLLLVEGSEFDFKNKKYREIKSILSISVGTWKPIPETDYISVFRTNETITLRSRTAEANVSNEIIKLNLFYNTNQKIEAYETYDENDAFMKAKEIATVLNVDILDATERKSKWL
ncbi:hypothetical protein [Winogradskyella sp. UBA3174]|uniref:hypothetical protein n=1 Tax=Winogradskyella sp. UBA3174 TaxID=1947785 RepID=UPI0025CE860C|nr:hypothetical protein [Winogradskyella sp. UBA3174]|tara:strand:- start:53114 stop:53587 length:474 start_codon:yes stop_codon:yes gene_type:complete